MSYSNYRRSTKPRQDWAVGNQVKVGFLNLIITGGKTDCWQLTSLDGHVHYEFEPYRGLFRVGS